MHTVPMRKQILKRNGKLFFDCKKNKPMCIALGFKEVKLRKLPMMWSAVFLLIVSIRNNVRTRRMVI